mgnify:FL=1
MIYIMSMNLGTIWNNYPASNTKIINKPNIKRNQPLPKNVNNISTRSFWGAPTWYFFHTIASRINPTFYANNYEFVWDFIKDVCAHIPCPYCQRHAIDYTSKIAIHSVNSKEKLETVMFDFHNFVNTRTGKKRENRTMLQKYKKANIKAIFDLFEVRFFHSYIGRRNFDDWIKNDFKKKYYDFCNTVRTQFN